MSRYLSLIGTQIGKVTFTKVWKGNEIVASLTTGVAVVPPNAQRTLAKGANTTPTHKLVEKDKVHETPRMKDLVAFLNRVMDNVEQRKDVSEGFLGAVLMVIPEEFTSARWEPIDAQSLPREAVNKVGFLVVEDAGMGQPAFHIGDGQGRFFGLYSMEFVAKKAVSAKSDEIDKARKAKKDARALEKELKEREVTLKRVQKFIRELQLTVVCYARTVRDDGTIVGLDLKAQRRLFVEGNALNSKAGKEAQLKFDTVSPIGTALFDLRVQPETFFWMDPDYIEEDNKSIAKGSSKLFTLSALTQAYGWSIANTTKVQRLDAEMYEVVGEHKAFTEAFWRKVTEVFKPLWYRGENVGDGEWLDYLAQHRAAQNVAFQAVFLQALGRFGYNLGVQAKWNPDSDLLVAVEKLAPGPVEYRAFRGQVALVEDAKKKKEWLPQVKDVTAEYAAEWTIALMKARTGKDTSGKPTTTIAGYTFNNVRDSVTKTYHTLLAKAAVPNVAEAPSDDDADDAVVEMEAEV